MPDHKYSTVKLKKWKDYSLLVQQFSENWAFRGQADARWVLNNAIERTAFIKHHKGIEIDFIAEFERGARNYLSKDETPEHLIEWLALMQHHGAPTRLLDLSKSPFIGAYFAFEISVPREDHYVAVWGINVNYLKNKALELLTTEFGEALAESKNLINETLFEKIFYSNNLNLVFPVEPFRMNRRYSLQQSIFVSTGIAEFPLMKQLKFLGDDIEKAVVKIEIPSSFKNEALRDLLQMNLHRASLFPDLDGYASSLRLRYESMKTPEEIAAHQKQKLKDKNFPFFP
jgi:hypothetical protein